MERGTHIREVLKLGSIPPMQIPSPFLSVFWANLEVGGSGGRGVLPPDSALPGVLTSLPSASPWAPRCGFPPERTRVEGPQTGAPGQGFPPRGRAPRRPTSPWGRGRLSPCSQWPTETPTPGAWLPPGVPGTRAIFTESRKHVVCSLVVPKSGVQLRWAALVALSLLPFGVASRDSGSQSRSGSICGCLSRL